MYLLVCLFIFLFVQINSECPNFYYYEETLGKCLFRTGQHGSWGFALDYCTKVGGGNLPSIHNAFENNFFYSLQENDKYYWLGAQTGKGNETWSWSDGTPFDYQRFADPSATESYAYFRDKDQMWHVTGMNSYDLNFICVADARPPTTPRPTVTGPTIPPLNCLPVSQQPLYNCQPDWTYSPETGYEYLVIYNATFDDAEKTCQSMGTHLASIHSDAENDFVLRLCCQSGESFNYRAGIPGMYTIGGKWILGKYLWTDGTPFDYNGTICDLPYQRIDIYDTLYLYNFEATIPYYECPLGTWGFGGKVPKRIDDGTPYAVCKRK